MIWNLARRTARMNPSVLRELLSLTEQRDIISFAGGVPSPSSFPVQAFAAACEKVLRQDGAAALQYASSEGYGPLREIIAATLPWPVKPDEVLITTGSQQGLDLLAKVLIDPGAPVAVETPTYLGALQAFAVCEPKFIGLPCGDDGLDLDAFSSQARDARFLYLLPNYQNPTGRTMPASARHALVERASEMGLPLLEDNPYGELWFGEPPPLPLTALNPEGCIYLGSLSKILAPGLRLGFVVAPRALRAKLLQAKQAADLHTPSFNQRLAADILQGGFLQHHGSAIRALYRGQRDAMLAALDREMRGLDVAFNRPDGGMFVWLRLPAGFNAAALLPRAVELGVAFVPGEAFFVDTPDPRCVRLSFATATREQMDTGISVLAQLIRESSSATIFDNN
ncbi:aminotransferase-like domain-containing protein [Hydrogenophaga sp. BPS33]|uniref:aminotransferase-like domain-containing protein n=1 Tax=Hydrogenophaga sp. BPS33 TaxID=2651974 RepID=UPI00131F5F2E|nr:PLP-dependent aminotransferase family protein [Hydrogenophaga sp. BPS33]QHE84714.1 PLP-dependent aminotransferase family protein [Hydrogenophaga sp. BPS33]